MKRFDLFILLICLIINDDSITLVKAVPVRYDIDLSGIKIALESILKINVTRLNGSVYDDGTTYLTKNNELIFVKDNSNDGYDKKVHGEFESLKTLRETKTVLTPRPITYGHTKEKNVIHFIALEFMNFTMVDEVLPDSALELLGSQIADLHMYNWEHSCKKHKPVKKFGFHVDTSSGYISQNNTWTDDWITFFIENRMNYHIRLLSSKTDPKKKEIVEDCWSKLKPIIPKLFEGIEVKPTLLHGDLWEGNIALHNSKPIIFDPASFYGHHEYDLATTFYLGGLPNKFYEAYFKKIPEVKGFKKRMELYHIFINLYRWNNYEGGYIDYVINDLQKVLKSNGIKINSNNP